MTSLMFENGTLTGAGSPILHNMPGNIMIDQSGFLRFTAGSPADTLVFSLGDLVTGGRWVALYRFIAWWNKVETGVHGGDIPAQTQCLLCNHGNVWTVMIPLVDEDTGMRCTLRGTGEHSLELVAESGSAEVTAASVTGGLVLSGYADPYTALHEAAKHVNRHHGGGILRQTKSVPQFIDAFGWCTWDAFYGEVSQAKVRAGLQSFKAGGVQPRYMILDDGWLSVQSDGTRGRLTGFAANDKFPGGLSETVTMAKGDYRISDFIVWHAFQGYWHGVDAEAMPEYAPQPTPIKWSNEQADVTMHIVPPHHAYRFYQDFYRELRAQGVDGVKVDNQASIEWPAYAFGGRVELMQRYREAMEGAAAVHLNSNVINCMSCSTDMLYSARATTLTRTSDDFFPNQPESHGMHIWVNTMMGVWFTHFVHPDWDMFQSGHTAGPLHAAARAISGGPVYVSDKPGEHDFDLLRKLVTPDGSILRAKEPGRPTRDCLLVNPLKERVLYKIVNRNAASDVIGVFNLHATGEPITGKIKLEDVGMAMESPAAVYAHNAQEMRVMGADDTWEITLSAMHAEVFTVVAIKNGVAPIGLLDLFNAGGAVEVLRYHDNVCKVDSVSAGRFGIYCKTAPLNVTLENPPDDFTCDYDEANGLLVLDVPGRRNTITVEMPEPSAG